MARDDKPRAWGRDGYVREGLADAGHGFGKVFLIIMATIVVAVAGWYALRWAVTEYYITTHCTEVLGTRVCQ